MASADDYAKWIVDNAAKKGTPEFDTVASAYKEAIAEEKTTAKEKPIAVQAGGALNDIGRQVGLTARYGIEGLANTAQLVTEPLRYATDSVTPNRKDGGIKSLPLGVMATQFADRLGLPSPQGANERVVGEAARLMVGGGGLAGGASALSAKAPAFIEPTLKFLAANPVQQITSAAGAGLAGGASKEAGGSALGQATSALVGGVIGGKAPDIALGATNLAKTLFNRGLTTQQLDVKISNVLRQSGVDYSQMPERVRQSLRADMASALNTNKELDAGAVSRLAAFKEAGITPTRGMVSQNPVQITQEMNLAKMGANSSDEGLSGLALLQNQNNAKLIGNLNTMGANRGNLDAAGERITSTITGQQANLRNAEQSAWNAAKDSPGYRQPISSGPISDINNALGEEALMPFMNPTISKYMEAFQTGQPFTPQAYRNLQSMLSKEVSKGGNEGAAASLAQRVLLRSDLAPAGLQNPGNLPVTPAMGAAMRGTDNAATDAIGAINTARNATRAAYAFEDSSPIVRSVLSGGATSDPARIAQRFVIGGTPTEAADLIRQVGPNGLPPIKDAILAHLKEKALNGAADETGKFSQAAFNKALNAIGQRKLGLLFTPEEVRALQTNGRVAALMQSQPVGSAVNNSNSGALLLGRGLDYFKSVPVAGPFVNDIRLSIGNKAANNVLPSLVSKANNLPAYQPLLVPALLTGGLLSAQ